jgi:hypothetical protein
MRLWIAALALLSAPAFAEEGMWTIDAFPAAKVKTAYGFAPDKAWLERIQKASVRLEGGCSGSVVSKQGLVLTNHHCVTECIDALSSDRSDLMIRGFVAASRQEERVCPGLEASILESSTDVTERVKAAMEGVAPGQITSARTAAIAIIEQDACRDAKEQACEVVSLYRGGRYMLYRYSRFTDVRLVFAPEFQTAFFGGDPDNFNFPRYAFDAALLRLYRGSEPAMFTEPLRVDPAGPKAGDLVFTSGHPGATERLLTVSQLEFQRDHFLPWRIEYLAQVRGALLATGRVGEEELRQVRDALFSVENSVKVFRGRRQALAQPAFFAQKVAEEQRLKDALARDERLRQRFGDPFADLAALRPAEESTWMPYQMLELRLGAGSTLLADARTLLRGAGERSKPSAQRLPEFADARLPALARALTAQSVVHPVLERLEIEFWLLKTREALGADHPAVKAMFGQQSASQIAEAVVSGSRLGSPAVRQELWTNPAAASASTDPAIELVRRIDEFARRARSEYETRVSGPTTQAAERVAGLRFAVLGDDVYPDATFTLRVSYGAVKGWNDPQHGEVGPFTFVKGLYERATGAPPFDLVERWAAARTRVDGELPMNLVSTNDIIGGNSGSPLVNQRGRIVGLVFDGNIHSLGGNYGFDAELNRTVSVASPIILAALRSIYSAGSLADEMLRG